MAGINLEIRMTIKTLAERSTRLRRLNCPGMGIAGPCLQYAMCECCGLGKGGRSTPCVTRPSDRHDEFDARKIGQPETAAHHE